MAIQIFDEGPTLGGRIGAGFSSGISRGLDNLAKQNLQTMKLKQAQDVKDAQARNLRAQAVELYGTPEQKAAFRSQQVQQPQQSQSTGSEWLDELINVVGGGQAQQQQAQVPLNELLSTGGAGPVIGGQGQAQAPGVMPEQQMQAPQAIAPQAPPGPAILNTPTGTPQEEAAKLKQLGKEKIANAALDFKKQQALEKKSALEKKIERDQFNKNWDSAKDFLDDRNKRATAERSRMTRYDTMDALRQTGELPNPLYYSILKKSGFDIPALLNPGKPGSAAAEAYLKTTQDFMTEMKDIFGARITEKMITEFLKTIPTLENTDEGKKLITDILRLKSEAYLAEDKIIDELIKENGGSPPRDLQRQLFKRAAPVFDNLSDQIIERINAGLAASKGGKELVGNTISGNIPLADGFTGFDKNGNPIITKGGTWVLDTSGVKNAGT